MSRYDHEREVWERNKRRKPARRSQPHPTTAKAFEAELLLLAKITGDVRFSATLDAVHEHRLCDKAGAWRRQEILAPSIAKILGPMTSVLVRKMVERGQSVRVACAILANAHGDGEPGATFDATVDRIERIYRANLDETRDLEFVSGDLWLDSI